MSTQQGFYPSVGFYFKYGGRDLPLTYSPRKNFGFDNNGKGPIFAYSVDDIIDVLYNNYIYNRNVTNNNDFYVQSLVIQNAYTDLPVYTKLDEELFETSGYKELFNVIDFMYEKQYEISRAQNPNSKLIELLQTTRKVGTGFLIDDFTEGSTGEIDVVVDKDQGRINSVYFQFEVAVEDKDERTHKEFEIYFNPNYLVAHETPGKLDVSFSTQMTSTDPSFSNFLSNKNMNVNRLSVLCNVDLWSLASMEVDRNYKTINTLTTTYRVIGLDGKVIMQYNRSFYIHSHLRTPMTEVAKITYVKDYILNSVFGAGGTPTNEKMETLYIEYPDLFYKYVLDIYPYSEVGPLKNLKYTSVISYGQIKKFLQEDWAIPFGSLNPKCIEVFLIEGIGKHDDLILDNEAKIPPLESNKQLTMPLIAVCQSTIPMYGPISDNYSSLTPRASGAYTTSDGSSDLLFYIKKLIKLPLGIYRPSINDDTFKYNGVGKDVIGPLTNKDRVDIDKMNDVELSEFLRMPGSMGLATVRKSVAGKMIFETVSFVMRNTVIKLHGFKVK